MIRGVGAALAAAGLFCCASSAAAHSFKRSFADVKPAADGTVSAYVDFDPDDLDDSLKTRFDTDASGMTEVAELEAGKVLIAGIVRAGMVVYREETRCTSEVVSTKVSVVAQMIRVGLRFTCPAAGPYRIEFPLLERVQTGHAHFLSVRLPEGITSALLGKQNREWVEAQEPTLLEASARFFVAGIEHILAGYDHLLFLFALLVVAASLREIITVVTAFTVAHSMTLIAASLDVVALPDRVVESAIALTIAGVGVQNFFIRDSKRAVSHRWLLTFGLGLIHGFGFASVLAELQMPSESRILPLLSFNLGVEAGQVALVLLVVPALTALRQGKLSTKATVTIAATGLLLGWGLFLLEPLSAAGVWALALLSVGLTPIFGYRRTVVLGGSAVVVALGTLWFVTRAFGLG